LFDPSICTEVFFAGGGLSDFVDILI